MCKKSPIIFFFSFFLVVNYLQAQLKIGNNPTVINPSAVLEIESNNKGILIPRIDLLNNAPSNPSKSLLVWNTNASYAQGEAFYFFNGTTWQPLNTLTNNNWMRSGNNNTNSAIDFLGTTDNQPLVIKTNNANRLLIGNDQANEFTNLNASNNLNRSYSNGNLIGFNNILDATSGTQAGNLFGIENLQYLRSGTSLNASTGTLRGLRNRLWNVQTTNYPFVQGVYNDYRGEVTDITDYRGFTNFIDLRVSSNITNFYGFTTEFNQANGVINNFFGFSNFPSQTNLNNYTNYNGFYQSNLGNSASRYAFFYDATEANTNKVVISGQGRIGIGTTTPTSALEITSINPVKITQLASGISTDEIVTVNPTGELRKLSMVNITTPKLATLTLPSGNGVVRHNYDIGLTGSNSNVEIFKITGTTQQFTITGFTGGTTGRIIRIYNTAATGNMILSNEDSNSLPQNRIRSLSGGNSSTNNAGIISLFYDSDIQRWIIMSVEQ